MITLTREEAVQILDALGSCDETWVYDGEDEQIVDQYDHKLVAKALETLHAKLSEYPKNKVPPHEFVAAATGKENLIGMPIIWAEWPTKEQV